MLFQRMVADAVIGLNYDYMGYAEYEFGATSKAREGLARLQIERKIVGRKTRFFERYGRSTNGPIDVFVFGSEKSLTDLGIIGREDPSRTYDFMTIVDKCPTRMDDEKIIGWLSVRARDTSILIIRATQENIERGNKYLQAYMDQILEDEEKEKAAA